MGFGLGMSAIEAAALVNGIVDQSSLHTVDLFNRGESALSMEEQDAMAVAVYNACARHVERVTSGAEGVGHTMLGYLKRSAGSPSPTSPTSNT